MAKKQIPYIDKLYELRTDVWTPRGYWRAGQRLTAKQWHKEFGEFNIEWAREWFIDLSEPKEKQQHPLSILIDKVFNKYKLHSLTYKEAAFKVAELWLKQNQSK